MATSPIRAMYHPDQGMLRGEFIQNLPRSIRGAIIDKHPEGGGDSLLQNAIDGEAKKLGLIPAWGDEHIATWSAIDGMGEIFFRHGNFP